VQWPFRKFIKMIVESLEYVFIDILANILHWCIDN
jgi:hypothetical protein